VLFATEIIIGELRLGDVESVVISAITASTVARLFLGDRPAFAIPNYGIKTPWEILLYALLGVLAALVAVGFIRLLYAFEDRFDNWHFPEALKPAVGGLLLGGLAFFYPMVLGLGFVPEEDAQLGLPLVENIPHVLGSGFPTIEAVLLGDLSFGLLVVLIFLKPLATSLTLGSGNSGGVFAPALLTGAVLGGAFGQVVEFFAPGATAGSGAFAVVGMAAVFAGAARAPFTAILIVFELTDDYRLIVPLMASVIISLFVAERLHRESIYTLKLTQRGINFRRGRDVDVMETVQVDEVMMRQPITLPADLPVALLADEFLRTGQHGFPVLENNGYLLGVVSLGDYRRAMSMEQDPEVPLLVRHITTKNIVSVYPDESVDVALQRMAPRDLSRLPVVAREDEHRLLGEVRRNDIVHAYEVGALRREDAHYRGAQNKAVQNARVHFVEVTLTPDSHVVLKPVAEIALPRGVVLVSIRRGREMLIPHGDTQLMVGDIVTALCERGCADEVVAMLGNGGSQPQDVQA
jgi:CIC family chloride channel protein